MRTTLKEIVDAVESVANEKGIDKEIIFEALEAAPGLKVVGVLRAGVENVDVPASDVRKAGTVSLQSIPPTADLLLADLRLLAANGALVARYQHEFFLRAWRDKEAVFPADLRTKEKGFLDVCNG